MTNVIHRCRWAALAQLVIASSLLAGPLNPPAGPIAPTPKIEARTPISATTTPSDGSGAFTISQPGSYYLTGDVVGVSGRAGINVVTSGAVTIDLNGFSMTGVPGATTGIASSGGAISVVNGTVANWPSYGVQASRVDNVVARANGLQGIFAGDSAMITRCTVVGNGTSMSAGGIVAGSGSIVTDCIVRSNGGPFGGHGIRIGYASQVARCIVESNSAIASGGSGFGIFMEFDGVISDCRVNSNGTSGVAGTGGISIDAGTHVLRCSLYGNRNVAILVGGQSSITENTIGGTTAGPAISSAGTSSRIDGNHLFANSVGIRLTGTANTVVRNSVRGGTGFDIVAGNDVGPIGAASTATSPWANLRP